MELKRRLWNLLARGAEPADAEPDARVEVIAVPLPEGPLLVGRLRAEGIDATGLEAFDVVTKSLSRMSIVVRQADLEAAREVLDRVG